MQGLFCWGGEPYKYATTHLGEHLFSLSKLYNMKMIKMLTWSLLYSILQLLFLSGCSKSPLGTNSEQKVSLVRSKSSLVPNILSIEKMDNKGELWDLLVLKEFDMMKGLNVDHATIYKVKFDKFSDLLGIQIEFENKGDTTKDLFFVVDQVSKTHLSVMREKAGFENNSNGSLIFKDAGGAILDASFFENNRLINKDILNIDNPMNEKISLIAPAPANKNNMGWSCSQKQLNNYYKAAKKSCEEDVLCDVVCSFNPCAISYLAYAVGKCSGLIQ